MIDDLSPAFPGIHGDFGYSKWAGMSLRDYFAAAALTGVLAAQAGQACEDCMTEENAAGIAFNHADAMLAERLRSPTEQQGGGGNE